MLDTVHWNGSSHTKKKVVIQERIQAQSRSETPRALTVLNWNGSKNTFAVHMDIEPFRDHFRTVPRTVSGVV